MTKTLTKADILAAPLVTKEVTVPEWGGAVQVRVMSGVERDQLDSVISSQSMNGKVTDPSGFKLLLVRLTVCNEDGSLIFDKEDADALNATSGTALERVALVAMELNGMSATSVNGLEGNLPAALNDSSGSD